METHHDPKQALEAADALISRIEDRIADHLAKKGDALDEKEAFYEIVQMLETAPESPASSHSRGVDSADSQARVSRSRAARRSRHCSSVTDCRRQLAA